VLQPPPTLPATSKVPNLIQIHPIPNKTIRHHLLPTPSQRRISPNRKTPTHPAPHPYTPQHLRPASYSSLPHHPPINSNSRIFNHDTHYLGREEEDCAPDLFGAVYGAEGGDGVGETGEGKCEEVHAVSGDEAGLEGGGK
jgi:hypothetical protein